MTTKIKKIIIVGDNLSAWISAAALINGLKEHGVEISILNSTAKSSHQSPIAESASLPSTRFHRILCID